ncbi:MAG: LptF/LptG family permease [Prevotellaceae bacterium]|jgi:lipopolysaccharide export system permease protein|nr:LptF/LptG family permease [Prevotellaceae bacterium]
MKRIDRYLILRFTELFLATFFICSFILLLQFLWKRINDIVGKGLDFSVLAEFFFYSALSVVPLALPLAILLASLMTFGNLGEKFELIAMKAAGISLFRIMQPLVLFICVICIGAFFFSNSVLPKSQSRLWSLVFAVRETSPELEIPTGEFYSGINGYNIYVREKVNDNKTLKDIMIYDFSKGFSNASVTVADSALLQMSPDKMFLMLSLYNGESFENLKNAGTDDVTRNIPYRRESFDLRRLVIDFNANLAEIDADAMRNDYISKDLNRLQHSIDSLSHRVDSIKMQYANSYPQNHFFDRNNFVKHSLKFLSVEEIKKANKLPLFTTLSKAEKIQALINARNKAQYAQSELESNLQYQQAERKLSIRHSIEWHRKFTLSFACLIFFFIGAPLGAIIRKGGLGMPVVISVVMFIIYYIIDNMGYKMARDDVWTVWQGIWLSSACLLPIGIFFTYKAATDSVLFNAESYMNFFKKIRCWLHHFGRKNNR